MKTKIEVELKPFTVPNFAVSKTHNAETNEARSYALRELDADTLEAMCEEFTKSVFEKAGKARPPQPERSHD